MAISLIGSTGGAGATNGGTLTRTIPVTVLSGDIVVVCACQGTAVTGAFTVTSSSGGALTQALSSVFQSSNVKLGVFYIVSSGQSLTQVLTSGTGGSSDTTNSVVMVFRGVSTAAALDGVTGTTSNGSGTTPDSPSITPGSGSTSAVLPFAVVSAFGASIQDTAVTQPTSWALTGNGNATDNRPSTVCAAWITYQSTAAFNPGAWSGLTSATWVSATVLLRPEMDFGWSMIPIYDPPDYRNYEVVGY